MGSSLEPLPDGGSIAHWNQQIASPGCGALGDDLGREPDVARSANFVLVVVGRGMLGASLNRNPPWKAAAFWSLHEQVRIPTDPFAGSLALRGGCERDEAGTLCCDGAGRAIPHRRPKRRDRPRSHRGPGVY